MSKIVLNRFWKLTALTLLLLAGVVLALFRSPGNLERLKEAMKARGEKLSMAELAQPVTPATAAAMQKFTGAVARLRVRAFHPSAISAMEKSTPGFAKLAWAGDGVVVGKGVTRSWDDFHLQIQQNEAVLGEIRALLREPLPAPSYDLLDLFGPSHPPLIAKRQAVQWLWGAAANALHRGELDGALTNLHAIIGLFRMNEEETLLVSQMIRVAIAGLGMTATWEALQAPGWDEARLADLQKRWERLEFLPKFRRTLEMERAMGLDVFQCARTNSQKLSALFPGGIGGIDSTNSLAQTFNEDVYLPVWQTTWSRHDEWVFLSGTERVLEAIEKANASRSFAEARPLLDQQVRQTRFNQFRFPLSDALVPNWRKAIARTMREESFRQMTIAALAIKRHQLRHRKLPERLQELVPDLLSEIPRDYMTGKALFYQRNSDGGTFMLHSAGENGRDDNGLGDDVVWPLPEWPPPRS